MAGREPARGDSGAVWVVGDCGADAAECGLLAVEACLLQRSSLSSLLVADQCRIVGVELGELLC